MGPRKRKRAIVLQRISIYTRSVPKFVIEETFLERFFVNVVELLA